MYIHVYSYRFLYICHLLKARQTNNAFDRVFVTLTETQDTVLDLMERTYRNCEYKIWGKIGWGMQFCVVFVCRDSTDDSYWISAKFYGIVSLHKYIALKNDVKSQLFVTVVIKWKNGMMYSPVTYISGSRFNSRTKYFYLSTISTPRSEKSNREGMYWIRIRHWYRLVTQTRIKEYKNYLKSTFISLIHVWQWTRDLFFS